MGTRAAASEVNRVLVALTLVFAAVSAWALATRGGGTSDEAASPTYWVSLDGDDTGTGGKRDHPWATLQHAADSVGPGATVYVREGTYAQRVEVGVSGEPGRPVRLAAAPGEAVVLDGSSLEAPAGRSAMIEVDSQRYVAVEGSRSRATGALSRGTCPSVSSSPAPPIRPVVEQLHPRHGDDVSGE